MAGKTFVGFGFGPIQSGLFLLEAHLSGNFSRYVVAEVDGQLVEAMRKNGGSYVINVARRERIDQVTVKGVELYNPRDAADREAIVAAVAEADEIATALPSVSFYDSGGEASVARLLARGLFGPARKKPAIIYAAENHNDAAEILEEKVSEVWRGTGLRRAQSSRGSPVANAEAYAAHFQVLNTVIGKMSGVITDPETIKHMGLATMTPTTPRAILVEEFNRILISRITLPGFDRGIKVFLEKDDLLPFEEAKLYGHNAIHALIGFLANQRGLTTMAEAASHAEIMGIARRAFIDESGAALVRRHAKLDDGLFTPAGYRAYAEDLLERMVRPTLNDLVARVIRDPLRKLAYDDRFYGTMRVCLEQGVRPMKLARGAAAAVKTVLKAEDLRSKEDLRRFLLATWGTSIDAKVKDLIEITWGAMAEE